MKKNKGQGFTLFELLVSISIIAILTVVAIVSYSNAQKKARDARRIQDVDAVGKALEQYYADNTKYPDDINDLVVGDYIQQLPASIKTGYDFSYGLIDETNSCYCSKMEDQARGNSTSANCDIGSTGDYYCRKGQQE